MALFDFFKRKRQPAPAPKPAPAPVAAPAAAPADVPASASASDANPQEAHDFLPDPGPGVVPAHDGPERRERERRHARNGTRVLVIDDSPTIVALLKRMLQQNHLQVLEAGDAETGIEVARREVPDLIFLDIVLPGMDGFSALRTLRRDPATRSHHRWCPRAASSPERRSVVGQREGETADERRAEVVQKRSEGAERGDQHDVDHRQHGAE